MIRKACVLLLLSLSAQQAGAQTFEACGSLQNAFGPIDYRSASPANKNLVERAHFTATVERLQRGNTTIRPGPDIDYTLRAFPNHPRALSAMMRLAEREKVAKPHGSRYTIDCWFDRALRFQPEDGAVRMLFGTYLARHGKPKEALEQLELARELLGDNDGNAHYNLGLAYTDLKQYDKALEHAHKAYALGFDLPGLRAKLQRAGKWRPLPAQAAATAPAAPDAPKAAETQPAPSAPVSSAPPTPDAAGSATP
jgi:Tfp pilus assembly protein PilF